MNRTRIAIFASGNGSNAVNIIRHFDGNPLVEIVFILANSPKAKVINAAEILGVKALVCTNNEAADDSYLVDLCTSYSVDFIVLAGFLRKIPSSLILAFPKRIINIHPALLPKYGGKGMYGIHVHEAVLANKETETGITIHFIDEEFDKGEIISQFKIELNSEETAASIQTKVQMLEHRNFANVIEKTITA